MLIYDLPLCNQSITSNIIRRKKNITIMVFDHAEVTQFSDAIFFTGLRYSRDQYICSFIFFGLSLHT